MESQPQESQVAFMENSVMTYSGISDIESECKRMIALEAAEHEKPTNIGTEIAVASVKALWGNCLGLIYNPDFKLNESL